VSTRRRFSRAIADLTATTEDEVHELERAGADAVIVHSPDV
jgi:glycerophosphoryl diester phosphodiesterase